MSFNVYMPFAQLKSVKRKNNSQLDSEEDNRNQYIYIYMLRVIDRQIPIHRKIRIKEKEIFEAFTNT